MVLCHFAEEHGCHYVVLEGDGHRSVENSYVADTDRTNCESDSDIGNDYTDVYDIQCKSFANCVADSDHEPGADIENDVAAPDIQLDSTNEQVVCSFWRRKLVTAY